MKDKPNYYAVLTANVRYDHDLPPNAKLLYAEISALCNMNGKCTASTKYFADLYNVSKVSIQKWLKALEQKNYINRKVVYKNDSKEIEIRYITIVNEPTQPKLTTSNKEKLTDNNNTKVYDSNNITYSNKRFVKPKINDIILYCFERKNYVDAFAFMDFYESKNWMIGKNKMKCWKSAVRTWERRDKNKGKLKNQINEYEKGLKML